MKQQRPLLAVFVSKEVRTNYVSQQVIDHTKHSWGLSALQIPSFCIHLNKNRSSLSNKISHTQFAISLYFEWNSDIQNKMTNFERKSWFWCQSVCSCWNGRRRISRIGATGFSESVDCIWMLLGSVAERGQRGIGSAFVPNFRGGC